MATTLVTRAIILYDNFPGTAVKPPVPYHDMGNTSVGHNIAAPMWPLGTKWQVYCKGSPVSLGISYNQGFSTFVYLGFDSAIASAVAGVAGVIVYPSGNSIAATMTAEKLYIYCADEDIGTAENSGLLAVCISAMTNSYYGWAWCGGVAPIEYCSGLTITTTMATDDSVVASCELSTVLAGDSVVLRAQPTNSQTPAFGYSLTAD